MNIIEALKEAVKGKRVYRGEWVSFGRSYKYIENLVDDYLYVYYQDDKNGTASKTALFTAQDVLADDWEVVE